MESAILSNKVSMTVDKVNLFNIIPADILCVIVSNTDLEIASLLYTVSKQFHKILSGEQIWDILAKKEIIISSVRALYLLNKECHKAFYGAVRNMSDFHMYKLRPKILARCTLKRPTSLNHISAFAYIANRDKVDTNGFLVNNDDEELKIQDKTRGDELRYMRDLDGMYKQALCIYDKLDQSAVSALLYSTNTFSKVMVLCNNVLMSCMSKNAQCCAIMRDFSRIFSALDTPTIASYSVKCCIDRDNIKTLVIANDCNNSPICLSIGNYIVPLLEWFVMGVSENILTFKYSTQMVDQVMGCRKFRDLIMGSTEVLKYIGELCSNSIMANNRLKSYQDITAAIAPYRLSKKTIENMRLAAEAKGYYTNGHIIKVNSFCPAFADTDDNTKSDIEESSEEDLVEEQSNTVTDLNNTEDVLPKIQTPTASLTTRRRVKITQSTTTIDRDVLTEAFKRFIDTKGSDTSIISLIDGGYYTVEWSFVCKIQSYERKMFLSCTNLDRIKDQILNHVSYNSTLGEYVNDLIAAPITNLRFSRLVDGKLVNL